MRQYKLTSVDTETVHGYARILSTPYRKWMSYTFEDCIHPLFIDGSVNKHGTRYFMFNLNFDVQAILKYLPIEDLRTLIKDKEIVYDKYKILFIRNKLMKIMDTQYKKTLSFYDVSQFYDFMGLDNAAKKYLNSQKMDTPVVKNVISHQDNWSRETMELYFKKNFDEISEYCQLDAILTQQLGYLLQGKIEKLFGLTLRNYASKAKIAEVLTDLETYPKFLPDSAPGRYAYYSFGGGIFDCQQKGYFDEITEIDISSAYPYQMVQLENLNNGNFNKIESDDDFLDSDYYGWLLVSFNCEYFPFKHNEHEKWKGTFDGREVEYEKEQERVYYPLGERIKPITLIEYRFLQDYGYNPELYNGYVWRKNKNIFPKPFEWINHVYNLKSTFNKKVDYEYSLTKIAMNGGYGKTCQQKGTPRMQNFFYASYITAPTRIQLIKQIIDNNLQDRVITIATDGTNIKGNFDLKQDVSGLGSWDVTKYDSGVILGNGMYQLNGPSGQKTALRGVTNKRDYDLIGLLQHNRNKTEITPMQHKKRPVTLNMGVNFVNLYTPDDINVFKERNRIISINSDKTKKWSGYENFGDLLDGNFRGERFTVNEIEDMK